MTYLTQAVKDMYPLLFRQPPRPNDLIKAASIGCNTLTTLLVDPDFQELVNELFYRQMTDALEERDLIAPGQAATGWKANLLNEFPSLLGEIKKVMVEHKIPLGLVDTICRQAVELQQPMSRRYGDIRAFFAMIERVRDDTCDLIQDIRANKADEAFVNRAWKRLLSVLYLTTGAACITFSTAVTVSINPDFPKTLIALSYELANLANVVASGFISQAVPPPLVVPLKTTNQKASYPFQGRVAISIMLVLSTIIGSIIYIKFTASYTPTPHQTTLAATRATPDSRLPFGNINGYFYINPNGSRNGTFDITTTSHYVFTESFPVIAFNPNPGAQNCSESTGVNTNTRPFTDILQNPDGSCKTLPVQDDSGHKAGLGNLYSFEAYFLTSITVPGKGFLTMQISADDGWIISIGANNNGGKPPTPKQTNIMTHPTAGYKSPINKYSEMGDNNLTVRLNFGQILRIIGQSEIDSSREV